MDFLKKKPLYILYFAAILFILFANNNRISIWDQDEGAYAGFSMEMLRTGNWLIPNFMWSDVHRKTPLHFWNIAISYKLFGINEFSVRLPSALAILCTLLFSFFAGRKLFKDDFSLLGTLVLCTSLLVPMLAKVSVTDATLLLFTTISAFSILFIIKQKSFKWTIIFWVSFALGLLTKGPPIVLFSGIFIFILLIFHSNRKNLIILHPWFFLPLACLPLFVWGYFAWQTDDGKFIQWMIDWYILKRIGGSVFGQSGPPGVHFIGLIVFFLPYFMFFPGTILNSFKSIFKNKDDHFLLAAWFISGWLFFELLPSKLPTYIIAAHVPLALLIGKRMLDLDNTNLRPAKGLVFIHFLLMSLLYLSLIIVPVILKLPSAARWGCGISGAICLVGLIIQLVYFKTKYFLAAIIGTNLLFLILIAGVILPGIDGLKNSSQRIGNYAKIHGVKNSKVYIANNHGHPPSLPFYLKINFNDVNEEYNMDILQAEFEKSSPCIIILNLDQKQQFIQKFKEAEYEEISSILIDRNQKASYYIFMNKAAQK